MTYIDLRRVVSARACPIALGKRSSKIDTDQSNPESSMSLVIRITNGVSPKSVSIIHIDK